MPSPTYKRLQSTFAALAAAARAAGAVERGSRPARRDLETLGIDPELYARIGK